VQQEHKETTMAYDTILEQGRFVSTGANVTLSLRQGVDWIRVYNTTAAAQAAADLAYEFYWQRGMATTGQLGLFWTKLGTVANDPVTVGQFAAGAGFILVDSSIVTPSIANALTAITAANPPVVTTAATLPAVGSIVRFEDLDNQPQIAGIDFTVTAIGGGNFTIGNINLTNSTASTAGFWRLIPFDAMFYPRKRYITWVENAVNPKVYMSVTHGFTVGQQVRLVFPGGPVIWENYAALDGVTATIIAINVARAGNEPNNGGVANNIQLNIDTSTFGAWNVFGAANNEAYPDAGAVPFSPAQVIPMGEDTGFALTAGADILADATRNTAITGITLVGGAAGPAGAAADIIFWVAGKSFAVNN